jgi:hypothetical protein
MERLLDQQSPRRITHETPAATGQAYWCAANGSLPSFDVKVNAREHCIK